MALGLAVGVYVLDRQSLDDRFQTPIFISIIAISLGIQLQFGLKRPSFSISLNHSDQESQSPIDNLNYSDRHSQSLIDKLNHSDRFLDHQL